MTSQCMIASTQMSTFGTTMTVVKVLSTPTTCTRNVNNAASCNPAGPLFTTALFASAMSASTMTMAVSCGWTCGCGTVTIDGATDGLPVELMDFEVVDASDEKH